MSSYTRFENVLGSAGRDDEPAFEVEVNEDDELNEIGDVIQNEDGSVSIVLEEPERDSLDIPEGGIEALPEGENLARYIGKEDLRRIGAEIVTLVKDDYDALSDWRADFESGLKLLGLKPEDRNHIFPGASGAWDQKITEAWVRFHAEIFNELWPAQGPVKTEILGQETQELRDQARRTKDFSNYYLRKVAREYYDDSEMLLNYTILAGCAFRKAYICPVLGRPVLKYIAPDRVAMPYSATGIWDAQRFTHINDTLSDSDLKIMQLGGYYIDCELRPGDFGETQIDDAEKDEIAGIDDTRDDAEKNYVVYETMLDYDLPGFQHEENGEPTGLPLPYKVTCSADGIVLRIEKNWDSQKLNETGLYIRKTNISQYNFMKLFGPLGVGLIQLLGGSSETRTKVKRMLQDSGAFSNFPPTVRQKGMRIEQSSLTLGPGTNAEIDTGGVPIDQAIKQMSVKEPSQMLKLLYDDEGSSADRLIGNMDIAVGDGRQDAPVGTTIALLAAAKKPQTGVMKRLHRALGYELEMLFQMFGQWLPEQPYPYLVVGGQGVVMRTDFSSRINPVPVSDPNMMSEAQRMMRAETVTRVVGQLPPNAPAYMVNAARQVLLEMGMDRVDDYLPPLPQAAQPKDPISENMDAAQGKPLKAFIEQNHDAHIAVHSPLAEGNPALQAHIAEHQAMKYKLAIENVLGFPFPPDGTVPPDVQERVAMMAAKATEQYYAQLKAQQPPAPPPMEEVMIMDIEQKREKEVLRHQQKMAELEQEREIADLQSDDKAAERASRMDIALMKTSSNLKIEDAKLEVKKIETRRE